MRCQAGLWSLGAGGLQGGIGQGVNDMEFMGKWILSTQLTYAYSISAYFIASARFSPRMTDLLTVEATLPAIASSARRAGIYS